jgi:hypothetical protein
MNRLSFDCHDSFVQRDGKIKLSLANESWTCPPQSAIMAAFLPNEPVQGIFPIQKFYD